MKGGETLNERRWKSTGTQPPRRNSQEPETTAINQVSKPPRIYANQNESSSTHLKGLLTSIGSINPAASILSIIFCFDLACRTRLAYVPAEAMNLSRR